MISKIRGRILGRRDNHDEGSDLVVTLFMIPFFIGLLFAIIDVSTYFQTKTQVQNITRDGARQIALYGGTSATIPLNVEKIGGKAIQVVVFDKLYSGGNCTLSACSSPPVVTCGPNRATSINQDAFCTVKYNYVGVGGALVNLLGFNAITDNQIVAKETFKVETRW